MKSRFTPQKDEVGFFFGCGEEFEPSSDRRFRQGGGPMLLGIDIAVAAGKITGRQDVEKNVSFVALEGQGALLKSAGHGILFDQVYGVWAHLETPDELWLLQGISGQQGVAEVGIVGVGKKLLE